jgi:hypothetical protein
MNTNKKVKFPIRQFNLVYDGKYKFVVKANGGEIASIKYMVNDYYALEHLQKIKSTIKNFSTSFATNEPNILFQWFGKHEYTSVLNIEYILSLYTCKDPNSNFNCVCLKYEPKDADFWATSRTILTVPIISKKRILKDLNLIIAKLDEEIKWYAELEKPTSSFTFYNPFIETIKQYNQMQSSNQEFKAENIQPMKPFIEAIKMANQMKKPEISNS